MLEDDDPPAPRMRNSKRAEKSGVRPTPIRWVHMCPCPPSGHVANGRVLIALASTILRTGFFSRKCHLRSLCRALTPFGHTQAEKSTKSRKRKEPAKELSKDEETIKRLKVSFNPSRHIDLSSDT